MFDGILNRERALSQYIPWRAPIADGSTLLADGSVLAIFEIDGIAWETAEAEDIAWLHNQLNLTWRNVARDELIVTVLSTRGEASRDDYLTGRFRSTFAARLDERYRASLYDHSLYSNTTLLCLQVRPSRPAGDWMGERLDRRRAARAVNDAPADRLRRLDTAAALVEAQLRRYGPRRLGLVTRNGALFSEPAEAIAYAITGVARPVPVTTGYLGRAMLNERLIFGRETIELRAPGRTQYAAMLGMQNYPAQFAPGMFGHLLAADYRHTTMHSFRCMNATEGQEVLTRKQNRMINAGDKATSQIADLSTAADRLQSAEFVMGDHAFGLCVFADSVRALGDVVTTAWRDLASAGVLVAREGLGNQASYLSMIPGNHSIRLRPGAISSRAFAAFAPLHAFPAGDRVGHWGEPLAMFRTLGGTPYRFHPHVRDLGNIFVTGRSGSGKTTWLGFILAQAERANATAVVWDKDRGLELAVRALGGSYLPLRNGVSTVAPLKALNGDNPTDVAFLRALLRSCIENGNYIMSDEEDRRLALGLHAVMALPAAERWLADICAFLPQSHGSARPRLEGWCHGREKGWILDGPVHCIDLSAPVIGFDQTEILDNVEARGPVMATLYHLCDQLIDGRRLLFVIDEFWKSLQDEAFRDLVHDNLKTLRKRGAAMILATQSPRDALASVIAHTIREQCPTGIHFGNPAATMADYGPGDGLGLSPVEVDIVRNLDQGDGSFLLRQGTRSLIAQLPLAGLPDEVAILSGRDDTVRLLDAIRAEIGDDPADWLPEFERRRTAPRTKEPVS